MAKKLNPNLLALRQAVRDLGGEIIRTKHGGKHFLVYVRTKKGNEVRLSLSKSPMRQGHIAFWARDHMNRRDRKDKANGKKSVQR